jgi:hypothetical protein
MSRDDPARPWARTLGRIAAHGWAIEYVLTEPGHAHFAYTIGLSDLDRPEVYVRDLPMEQAGQLLEEAAQAMMVNTIRQGQRFRSSVGLFRVGTDVDAAQLLGAIAIYGPQVKALELVRL